MSDISVLWNDIISAIRGKPHSGSIPADADKFLKDCAKVVAGLEGLSPDVPGLVRDVETLVTEGGVLIASKGLNLPELIAAGATLKGTIDDVRKAVADYKAAAAVAAAAASKG